MIKYNLKCHKGHEFESWFSNSDEFEKLTREIIRVHLLPIKRINKSIMAPMISSSKSKHEEFEFTDKDFIYEKNKLLNLRKFIEKNF